ncbi:MAG: S8 family peptidase [Armatimonadota bacterium]
MPRTLLRFFLLLGTLAALLGGSPAWAGSIADDLLKTIQEAPNAPTLQRVIVQFSEPGVNGHTLAALYGGSLLTELPLINGAALQIPLANLDVLAGDALVRHVSPDRPIYKQWDFDTQTTGASQVWASPGYRGGGVRVAVLDTGVYGGSHEWNTFGGAGSRIAAWKDFVNGEPAPYDDHGHGTHVAGIVLGSGSGSRGFVSGAAPDAELVAVKVLDSQGSGYASTIIQGLDWCLQNRASLGLRVINLSLGQRPGESYTTDPLCSAVRRAVQQGVVVVCSAGNQGKDGDGKVRYGGISCPGIEPAAVTVGALNTFGTASRRDDGICTYSSRGPTFIDHVAKPDLVAPGNRIVSVRAPGSTMDVAYPGNRLDFDPSTPATVDYYVLSGTSMAAPQVAATAALVLQANPALAPNAVKGILMYTAEELSLRDPSGRKLKGGLSLVTQGAGALNALGAVEMALQIDASAPVGERWVDKSLDKQSRIGKQVVQWRREIFWGGRRYFGRKTFEYHQLAWTEQTTWGDDEAFAIDQTTWSDDEVKTTQPTWSDDSVWGDQRIWGDQTTWSDDEPKVIGDPGDSATAPGP